MAKQDAPTHVRYFVLAAACSLAVLSYVQRQGFVAASPYVKKELALDDEQMGYLAAVWLVAYGAFQIPCGFLGDRLGARQLLTILVLSWSVAAGAVALTFSLPGGGWLPFVLLLVLRFLFGAFQAGGFPGLARMLADWMPAHQRGFGQGMVWTFSRLGGAVAPLFLLWLFTGFGGLAIPLWLIAGLGLLWTAGFWPWFRDRPEDMRQVNAAERKLISAGRSSPSPQPLSPEYRGEGPDSPSPLYSGERGRGEGLSFPWARFLTSVNVWALCLMYGFVGFAGNFVTNLLPIYLRDHRGLSDQTTAWLSGLPLFCGIFSCLLGGTASDWLSARIGSRTWGRRLVGFGVLVFAGLAVLTPIWAEETWLLAIALSAWFFCNDANLAPAWAACADVGEHYAGTLSGAMNMMGSLFGAAGTAFAGACFHRGLDRPVFIVFAFSYFLAAVCWLAIDAARPLVPKKIARI